MVINTLALFETAYHPASFVASNLTVRAPCELVDPFTSEGSAVGRQLCELPGLILGEGVDIVLHRLLPVGTPVIGLGFCVAFRLVRFGGVGSRQQC